METEQEWDDYTRGRVEVEAGFAVGPEQSEMMVSDLRERTDSLGLSLDLARDGEQLVGAIARILLPVPYQKWARSRRMRTVLRNQRC